MSLGVLTDSLIEENVKELGEYLLVFFLKKEVDREGGIKTKEIKEYKRF